MCERLSPLTCVNCNFFTLIFAVYLLMISPIYVNQTFNYLVMTLFVLIVGLIAISFIHLEIKMCISITGSGKLTIGHLMQFAIFTTNFNQVLCDLRENATQLSQ